MNQTQQGESAERIKSIRKGKLKTVDNFFSIDILPIRYLWYLCRTKGDLYKLIISRKRAIFPFLSLSCSQFSLYTLLKNPSQGISHFFLNSCTLCSIPTSFSSL